MAKVGLVAPGLASGVAAGARNTPSSRLRSMYLSRFSFSLNAQVVATSRGHDLGQPLQSLHGSTATQVLSYFLRLPLGLARIVEDPFSKYPLVAVGSYEADRLCLSLFSSSYSAWDTGASPSAFRPAFTSSIRGSDLVGPFRYSSSIRLCIRV